MAAGECLFRHYRPFLDGDTVVISVACIPDRAILMAPFFRDGDTLTECYTGQQVMVQYGVVRLIRYENGVAVFVRRK